ncbi:hypothetical protein [Paracraurococcus lichenis]|uniref:Uncharacterized protein n=1 Tax=Paracraurococcus lichenis TaxID=3064888 RepID=A0ABT9E2J1_9PROT|nr:hypothetical protein [Paracraurococcus sp. LOR1-02]MDO9710315.1 hypothetical protein [Paracraurococcus sp. LOR1-02]
MRRIPMLVAALGVALAAGPAFAQGGGSSDSSATGGLNAATPGSPAAGNLGSTPQEMKGRSEQPAQGAAVPLAPGSSSGRGANDPSAMPGARQTAPGGTAVMPGDSATGTRR